MRSYKPSKELEIFLRKNLEGTKCTERSMFGCPSYFINGNMFVGAFREDVFIRLPPEDIAKLLKMHPELRRFEPRRGVVMKEYLALPESYYTQKALFSKILKKSITYVQSLPRKKKRTNK